MKPIEMRLILPAVATVLYLSIACDPEPPASWPSDEYAITGVAEPDTAGNLEMDIYLDASKSMAGYAGNNKFRYIQFLEQLEANAALAFENPDVKLFKFGTRAKSISRDDYRNIVSTPAFFTEPGLSDSTRIEMVVTKTDSRRVSVVITDLFQSNQDASSIAQIIKNHCFKKGLAVAVLAVKSQFRGSVYDCDKCPYTWHSRDADEASYRPFYALMFGTAQNIEKVYDMIRLKIPEVNSERFYLLSANITKKQRADLKFDDREIFGAGHIRDGELGLRARKTTGNLTIHFVLQNYPGSIAFDPAALDLVVDRRDAGGDHADVKDFTLKSITGSHDSLLANFDITLPESRGWYLYRIRFSFPETYNAQTPAWIDSLSTDAPTQYIDPNKTLNFKKFVDYLNTASLAEHRPLVASAHLLIEKK